MKKYCKIIQGLPAKSFKHILLRYGTKCNPTYASNNHPCLQTVSEHISSWDNWVSVNIILAVDSSLLPFYIFLWVTLASRGSRTFGEERPWYPAQPTIWYPPPTQPTIDHRLNEIISHFPNLELSQYIFALWKQGLLLSKLAFCVSCDEGNDTMINVSKSQSTIFFSWGCSFWFNLSNVALQIYCVWEDFVPKPWKGFLECCKTVG